MKQSQKPLKIQDLKKGQKVFYCGHPAEIVELYEKDGIQNPIDCVSVFYNSGNGKTKAYKVTIDTINLI